MNRVLSKVVTLLLLALLLVVVAVGVRSYRTADVVTLRPHSLRGHDSDAQLSLATGSGRLLLGLRRDRGKLPEEVGRKRVSWITQTPEQMINLNWEKNAWRRMGFLAQSSERRGMSVVTAVHRLGAPFWFIALPLGLLAAVPMGRVVRRSRRRKLGLCSKSGYDIRTTPERCPECGTVVEASLAVSGRRMLGYVLISSLSVAFMAVVVFAVPAGRRAQASTGPTTRPVNPARAGLARNADVSDEFRAIASTIDPSKPYVFFYMTSRADMLRLNIASVQIFQRRDGRWRGDIHYLRPGQALGATGPLASVKVKSIREQGGDLVLTLVHADGTIETRSADADLNDPVRKVLGQLTLYRGKDWDKAFFSDGKSKDE